MARSILGTKPAETGLQADLRTAVVSPARTQLSGAALQARLRQKRSPAYIEAMTRLDAGTHLHGAHAEQATQDLLAAIRAELPEVAVDALPMGIVSKCYLGAPYEVHTLTCSGNIIQHFKTGEPLPALMERARSLAQHAAYAFIEVYPSRLITVSTSGQTAVIDI